MSASEPTKLETPLDRLVCRGCLTDSGDMKNMFDWDLSDDYFRLTDVESTRNPEISELLCLNCEAKLMMYKHFRDMCQMSDRKLKTSLKKQKMEEKQIKNMLTCVLQENKLVIMITAPKSDTKLYLPCPYHCIEKFDRQSHLLNHLKKTHNVSDNFEIELQYYCLETNCSYNISGPKNKFFTGRKFLNQHMNKVHKPKTFLCKDCSAAFATETEFKRHSKTCNFIFLCQVCNAKYSCHERLMTHLSRKHPEIHKLLKNNRKYRKTVKEKFDRRNGGNPEATITKIDSDDNDIESWRFKNTFNTEVKSLQNSKQVIDSPKKSLATQIPEDITNDVSLPQWPKTDEISTQTVFEDLLSLKSQNSEDGLNFPEAISLTDIQTQTFPVEFGLSWSDKETQSCINTQTQSPDLSIKETQTCVCHYDSPKPNFRIFDSLSSSPASINLTSTETQTSIRHTVKKDVLLSFSSAETQTCFEEAMEMNESFKKKRGRPRKRPVDCV